MSPLGGRFTIESPRRRMAKERLEAIDSLWWCVAWNNMVSHRREKNTRTKTNFRPVEGPTRKVPLMYTISHRG